MERNVLVNRIVRFYFETRLLDESKMSKEELEDIIADCLNKAEHVETIINTIIHRAKTNRNFNIDELIEMQTELERIRLNLEYKENAKVS